jgi:hypothetical protein
MVIRTNDRRQLWLPLVRNTVHHRKEDDAMVKRSEVFQSKWLSAADLNGGSVVATIKVAALETLKGFDGADTQKVVLYFAHKLKPLPLNRTNYDSVANIAGTDETDDWPGTKVEPFVNKEIVKGKLTDCVRIRKPATAAKAKPKKSDDPKPDYNDEVKF